MIIDQKREDFFVARALVRALAHFYRHYEFSDPVATPKISFDRAVYHFTNRRRLSGASVSASQEVSSIDAESPLGRLYRHYLRR